MTDAAEKHKICVFCDESCQTENFLAVAGIATLRKNIIPIINRFNEIRGKYPPINEIKWENSKRYSGTMHLEIVDLLFDLVRDKKLTFFIKFQDMSEYDHRINGSRKYLDTVSKSFFQLILHRPFKKWGKNSDLYIYADGGCCTELLGKQLGNLHFLGNQRGYTDCECIKELKCVKSDKEPMMQLLDVTLGAMAVARNRGVEGVINIGKRRVVQRVLERIPKGTIYGNADTSHFSIWNTKPQLTISRGRRH